MRELEETNGTTPSAQASIEKMRRAHERLKSIRIEYEASRAAAGTLNWQSIQDNLMIRARYTQAVDEFLNS
jgi:hypothetical protein